MALTISTFGQRCKILLLCQMATSVLCRGEMQAMSKATFYLLPNAAQQPSAEQLQLLACQLAGQHYAKGEWLYIHCEDQAQAHGIDELLWQFEPVLLCPTTSKGKALPPVHRLKSALTD